MRSDSHIRRLDAWLRTAFLEHNTALEEAYFATGVEFLDDSALAPHKQAVLREGAAVAGAVDVLPERASDRYELLGMVGFVLGACRRHEVEDPALLAPVWAVAERLGDSLGVAPRYVFAHQAFFNTAHEGRFRTFTTLPDEATFVELNGLAVLAYGNAAAALRQIPVMGVSHPLTGHLLDTARGALEQVLAFGQRPAARGGDRGARPAALPAHRPRAAAAPARADHTLTVTGSLGGRERAVYV